MAGDNHARTDAFERRVHGALLAFGCTSVLIIAALLAPSPAGHGTHTRLGLPPCGWAAAFDTPCITCGMTTAFSHGVRGDLASSFLTQPLGALLAIAAAVGAAAGAHAAITGSRVLAFYARLLRPQALWALAGVALAAWAYKWATWGD